MTHDSFLSSTDAENVAMCRTFVMLGYRQTGAWHSFEPA
jgi:hypothetical protein